MFSPFILAASSDNSDTVMLLLIVIVAGIILLIGAGMMWRFGALWVQSQLSGAPIGMLDLVGMSLRKVNPTMITQARIMSKKAGIDISSALLEAHALAGGN